MTVLQFITHRNASCGYVEGALAVLVGGCKWIQLRMKDALPSEIVSAGLELRKLCDAHMATLIIDDHVDLVCKIGADGVHLGKNDMSVSEARAILGHNKIIGATANNFDDICRAYESGADYIGLGPFRFTTTKKNLSRILGLEGYSEIMEQCRQQGIDIPVVAIGGIVSDDLSDLMKTGISGIAVSGALLDSSDPVLETRKFLNVLK